MRLAAASALAAALTLAASLPLSAQDAGTSPPLAAQSADPSPPAAQGAASGGSDYAKKAGNFLQNCDARKGEDGKRPDPPNYVCLAFLAGLVEGYNYGAVANGNEKPYCLPRPVSLAELSDMMVTVIERGVKPEMATTAVFHFLMEENFKCNKDASWLGDGALGDGEGIIVLAQASEPLLQVTPPEELEAREPKLQIVTPFNGSSAPLLPIVEPATTGRPTGADGQAAPSGAATTPATPQPVGEISPREATAPADAAPAAASGTEATDGTAVGPDAATGPITAPQGTSTATDSATRTELPLLLPPRQFATPARPATPSRPVGPQGPRRVGN